MVATLVVGFGMDFACMIIAEIHENDLKVTTTYPFPIFQLCRDSRVSVWHCDNLIWATKTLNIGMIRDEVNMVVPHREPQVEVPPLGADLVADVEQMQGDEPAPPTPSDDSPVANQSPRSSRITYSSGSIAMPLA
uniref:Integrase core domain containing protein n=1 Tax=Solanum tuberosum TaxID=4113 RepID=M1DN67_SOLTU